MTELVNYFWQHIHRKINQNDRYQTVLEVNDVLLVNFDCLYERECGLRAVDQLIFHLHKIGLGKKFIFISEDGAVLEHTGAIDVIKNIIDTFKLTNETCAVICREHIKISNATVVVADSIPYWCKLLKPAIQHIPIPQGNFTKKFAVWFNRGTIFRLTITQHLHKNYRDTSIISYQQSGVIVDRKMQEYYSDLITWAEANTPIVYDQLFPAGQYTHDMIVGNRHPYEDYFLEIVGETDIIGTSWITEKTIKNLYIGKPFLIMGGVGTLARLKSFGFETFSPWIDESYDSITNHADRLAAILTEIDRIATLDVNDLHNKIKHVLEYNRQHYLKVARMSIQ